MADRRSTDLLHGRPRFSAQDFEDALNTLLAERAETPKIWPPRAHGERLDDVSAATEAAIHQHRQASTHRLDDLRQSVDCGTATVFDATTMIRHNDSVDTAVDRQSCILLGEN